MGERLCCAARIAWRRVRAGVQGYRATRDWRCAQRLTRGHERPARASSGGSRSSIRRGPRLCSSLSLTAASDTPCRGVVHLWSLDAPAALRRPRRGGAGSLPSAAPCMSRRLSRPARRARESPRACGWSPGAPSRRASPAPRGCTGAALGPRAVIALEHPELRCARLDLDPRGEPARRPQLCTRSCAQTTARTRSPFGPIAYVARLRRAGASASVATSESAGPTGDGADRTAPKGVSAGHENAPRIGPDGAYLITGGLGGLGLRTARWLVERGARHLILVGRRAPWPAALAAIAELGAAGSQVMVEPGDVACRDDVARVLERVAGELPPLRGVVHAAGVLDDGVLSHQRWERFAAVLGPKVLGAANLDASRRGWISTCSYCSRPARRCSDRPARATTRQPTRSSTPWRTTGAPAGRAPSASTGGRGRRSARRPAPNSASAWCPTEWE